MGSKLSFGLGVLEDELEIYEFHWKIFRRIKKQIKGAVLRRRSDFYKRELLEIQIQLISDTRHFARSVNGREWR